MPAPSTPPTPELKPYSRLCPAAARFPGKNSDISRMQQAWKTAKLSAWVLAASIITGSECANRAVVTQRATVTAMHTMISRLAPKRAISLGACQNMPISISTPTAHSIPMAAPECPAACRCRV